MISSWWDRNIRVLSLRFLFFFGLNFLLFFRKYAGLGKFFEVRISGIVFPYSTCHHLYLKKSWRYLYPMSGYMILSQKTIFSHCASPTPSAISTSQKSFYYDLRNISATVSAQCAKVVKILDSKFQSLKNFFLSDSCRYCDYLSISVSLNCPTLHNFLINWRKVSRNWYNFV